MKICIHGHIANLVSSSIHALLRSIGYTVLLAMGAFSSISSSFAADPAETKAEAALNDRAALLKRFHEEFVLLDVGSKPFPAKFTMGTEQGKATETPAHEVTLSRPFAIARYEVPQNLYEAVMGSNPSRWKGARNSAERMSWIEAISFCEKVTALLRAEKLINEDQFVRLPTESEWEYACRAGTTSAFSFGDSAQKGDDAGNIASLLDPYGWHTGNAAGNDPEVGVLKPNPWGLYDMHGYLSEFTLDGWHESYQDHPATGAAWETPSVKVAPGEVIPQVVVRGGSWKDRFDNLRSASRQPVPITRRDDALGFRCVLVPISRDK